MQIVTVILAFVTASLDYEKTDKRTKAFKKRKGVLQISIAFFLIISISLTISEYCSGNAERRVLKLQREKERDNYENQIYLLRETNNIANQAVDSVKQVLRSAKGLHLSLNDNTEKLIGHYRNVSKIIEDQKDDLTNNVLTLDVQIEIRRYSNINDSKNESSIVFLPLVWKYGLYLIGYDESRQIDLSAHYFDTDNNITSPVSTSTHNEIIASDSMHVLVIKNTNISVLFKNPSLRGLHNINDVESMSLLIADDTSNSVQCNCSVRVQEGKMIIGGNETIIEQKFPDSLYEVKSNRFDIPLIVKN